MNKIEQFRYNVLEKLRQAFDKMDMAAILRDPSEGIPTHMLNVLHTELGHSDEEVMGEYYFFPIDENAKFHLFSCMLTLTEDMPDDKYEELGRAVNLLNFFLPIGAFVFDQPDKIMAFKYTSFIPKDFTEEEAINLIDGHMSMSLRLVNQYLDVFMNLMHGRIDFDDYLASLPKAFHMFE